MPTNYNLIDSLRGIFQTAEANAAGSVESIQSGAAIQATAGHQAVQPYWYSIPISYEQSITQQQQSITQQQHEAQRMEYERRLRAYQDLASYSNMYYTNQSIPGTWNPNASWKEAFKPKVKKKCHFPEWF